MAERLDFGGWRVSFHASTAVRSRGFAWADVLLAKREPEIAYQQRHAWDTREVRQTAHIAVVVSTTTKTIITVLLRADQEWTDADAKAAHTEQRCA